MTPKVSISEAIKHIRAELVDAAKEGKEGAVRFVTKSVEVELGVTFDVEVEAKGGFKIFSLVDISGRAKRGTESVHKLKLELEPVNRDGKPLVVRDDERERD